MSALVNCLQEEELFPENEGKTQGENKSRLSGVLPASTVFVSNRVARPPETKQMVFPQEVVHHCQTCLLLAV